MAQKNIKTVYIPIRMTEALAAAIDYAAERGYINRSDYIRAACIEKLKREATEELPRPLDAEPVQIVFIEGDK